MEQYDIELSKYINSNLVLDTSTFDKVELGEELPDDLKETDLCLVHVDKYFPSNGVISSSFDKKVSKNSTITYDGETKKVKFYDLRKTIHFCLNGVVSDHEYGTFKDALYCIIEPLEEQLESIYSIRGEDTWTTDSVKLSKKAIVMVPFSDETAKKEAKESGLNVICYKGDRDKAVQWVIKKMGYKPQEIGKNNIFSKSPFYDNESKIKKFSEEKNKRNQIHFDSIYIKIENNLRERDKIFSLLNGGELIDFSKETYLEDNDLISFIEARSRRGYFPIASYDYIRILSSYGIVYDKQKDKFKVLSNSRVYEIASKTNSFDFIEKEYKITSEELFEMIEQKKEQIEQLKKEKLKEGELAKKRNNDINIYRKIHDKKIFGTEFEGDGINLLNKIISHINKDNNGLIIDFENSKDFIIYVELTNSTYLEKIQSIKKHYNDDTKYDNTVVLKFSKEILGKMTFDELLEELGKIINNFKNNINKIEDNIVENKGGKHV